MKPEQHEKCAKYMKYYATKQKLAVILCKGIKPQISNWQKRSVPAKEELEEWWSRYQDLNIGVVFGQDSHLVGIDVDGKAVLDRLKEISRVIFRIHGRSKLWEEDTAFFIMFQMELF